MFAKDTDTYRYFDSEIKMMLEKPEPWDNSSKRGEPDALIRTARAYLAYGDPILKEGILSCYQLEKDGHYQACRCFPDIGKEDVSRDQTIGSLSALFIRGDLGDFKRIGPKLRWKLSKRYSQGLGMWLWLRRWWTIYGIVEFFSIIFGVLWNKLLYRLLGRTKVYDESYYMAHDSTTGLWWKNPEAEWQYLKNAYWANNGNKLFNEYKKKCDTSKIFKTLDSMEYPTYGSFLTVLMASCMPKSFTKSLLVAVLNWNFKGTNNLLVRALFDRGVSLEEIDKLRPMSGFRWTSRFDGSSYFYYLEGDSAKYNTIDKDILYGIINCK